MRRILLILLFGFLVFFAFSHAYMLYLCDVSLAPVEPECTQEVHLVSYADGDNVFKQNQHFQAFSAINRGIDHIHMYRRKDLDADFVERNKEILSQKKGAGYWLWKPYVILKTLKNAPENAIVIYLDSGFNFIGHVQPLVNSVTNHDIGIVVHDDLGNSNIQSITQRSSLVAMGCTDHACLSGKHVWAGIMVVKNTPYAREFIQKWQESCEKPDWIIQNNQECQHNADESILSVLFHQDPAHKRTILTSELRDMRVVRWHHRHPHLYNESLLPYFSGTIKLWLKKMYWMWSYPLARFT